MFHCDCCGLCCMNLDNSDLYSDLNRGDGICKYFDQQTHLCSIYDERPEKCNIDKAYERLFKGVITKEEYYKQNYLACKELKRSV